MRRLKFYGFSTSDIVKVFCTLFIDNSKILSYWGHLAASRLYVGDVLCFAVNLDDMRTAWDAKREYWSNFLNIETAT